MDDSSPRVSADVVSADAPSGMERRLVLRLLAYWRDLCGDGAYPSFDKVDPEKIPELWANCFVIDLDGHEGDPIIRAVGHALASTAASGLTNLRLSELPESSLIHHATAYVEEVVRKKVPISRGGEFKKYDGGIVLFRSVILPMSDDGETLCGLLGAANCREVKNG